MLEKEPQFFGKPPSVESDSATAGKEESSKPTPEKALELEKKPGKEKPTERLEDFIKKMSSELKKEGVPIDKKGRINIEEFKGIHPKEVIESDKKWIEDLKGRWERAAVSESRQSWVLSKEQIIQQKRTGEVWEMLSTAILHKNLGKDFIVARTSEYDDARNKVDNVILDKKSGNIVCAFDEIGAFPGQKFKEKDPRFKDKEKKILERNWLKGGADLKYGISLEKKQGKLELKKGPVYHIPLFYFALPKDKIEKGLKTFSPEGISSEEKEIFEGFIDSFKEQTETMEKEPLHQKVKERLELFEKYMLELK